jgi:D-sedoheptulose 7-phosphate isomerase
MNDHELEALYPFLHGKARSTPALEAALLASMSEKAHDSQDAIARFFVENALLLLAAARALAGVFRRDGRLFCIGNGGSSCDAAHVAVEFLHPVTAGRPSLPAVNLTADVATISAVGNDIGFEQVFARQIAALARPGDALLGLSTSGSSANVLAAFAKARQIGMTTIALLGGDGGRMRSSQSIEHCMIAATSSVHRVQECHTAAYHVLWDLVHTLLADDRGSSRAFGSPSPNEER